MDKRNFIKALGTKVGAVSVIMAGISVGRSTAADAAQRNTATWKVPPGIKKIRVRAWNPDGSIDMDRTLNVEPNQTFRIDAIED